MLTKFLSVAAALTAAMTMAINLAYADSHEGCDVNAEGMPVSATVSGEVNSIGFMVGARWGTGVLTLNNGKERKFHLVGAKALETGVAVNKFKGEVYNLKSIDDFTGTYYGASTKISIAASKGQGVVNNAECVIIKLSMDGGGLQVSGPAPGGVEVSFID
jgi:hypothetical protein